MYKYIVPTLFPLPFPTRYNTTPLTDGCWSPTRPALFFTSSVAGTMDVWDLVFKQNSPTLTVQVRTGILTLTVQVRTSNLVYNVSQAKSTPH